MTDLSDRIRQARGAAGFATAKAASDAFGWKFSTYAGHENGSRQPDVGTITRYARAFRVNPAWLLTGTPSAPPALGFSEPDAEPYTANRVPGCAEAALRNLRHGQLWQLRREAPGLQLRRGDVLAIEAHGTPQPGETVLCNVLDQTGEAHTRLRLFVPPWLSGCDGQQPDRVSDAAILGVVRTVVRTSSAAPTPPMLEDLT